MGLAQSFPVADGSLVNASKGQRSRLGKSRGEDGLVSTAGSLMVFANALFAGDLVQNESLVELLTPQNDSADTSTNRSYNFGLGIHIVEEGDQSWALMIGNGAGGEAVVGRELRSGLTFVALTNVFGAGIVDRTLERMMRAVSQGPDAT
jgi:hypothetical protein